MWNTVARRYFFLFDSLVIFFSQVNNGVLRIIYRRRKIKICVSYISNEDFCIGEGENYYTGCPKSHGRISFSIFSTIWLDDINFLFLNDRAKHQVFIHEKIQKYCSQVSHWTEIQKFSLSSTSKKLFFKVSFSIARLSWVILLFKLLRSFILLLHRFGFI